MIDPEHEVSITRQAELLGISRRTLINRLDEYGIARPRKRDGSGFFEDLKPGNYGLPRPNSMKEMQSPEFKAKATEGPVAFITVKESWNFSMGGTLLRLVRESRDLELAGATARQISRLEALGVSGGEDLGRVLDSARADTASAGGGGSGAGVSSVITNWAFPIPLGDYIIKPIAAPNPRSAS